MKEIKITISCINENYRIQKEFPKGKAVTFVSDYEGLIDQVYNEIEKSNLIKLDIKESAKELLGKDEVNALEVLVKNYNTSLTSIAAP